VLISFEHLHGSREVVLTKPCRKQEFALTMQQMAELPKSREDPGSLVQPLSVYGCGLLRGLLGGDRPKAGAKDRVLLHADARLVAPWAPPAGHRTAHAPPFLSS
jgi:hypothetical protein